MRTALVDLRKNLAEAVNRAAYGGERVIVERQGKPVAALVSLRDVELLKQLEDQRDLQAARKARKEKSKRVPLANVKARLGMK
jgi:prevent-host-death family protein